MVHRRGTFRFRYMFRYTVVAPCYLEALFYWAKGARFDSCLRTRVRWFDAGFPAFGPSQNACLVWAFLFLPFSAFGRSGHLQPSFSAD